MIPSPTRHMSIALIRLAGGRRRVSVLEEEVGAGGAWVRWRGEAGWGGRRGVW